jgi:hypothetical protein
MQNDEAKGFTTTDKFGKAEKIQQESSQMNAAHFLKSSPSFQNI